MSLREKQSIFALNIAKLIIFAYDNGYEITFGEAKRPMSMQILYYLGYTLKIVDNMPVLEKGYKKSWTLNSKHLSKLAIDINLFKDGEYLTSRESHKVLAEYWVSLHPDNDCGYFWKNRKGDANHYQMN